MSDVGHKTYFAEPPVFKGNMNRVIIGAYCSIGAHVTFDCGYNHDGRNISTFPFHTLGLADNNNITRGDILIGNDVWIGDDCVIMSGVTVGDGCIIGTRSIITKDVKPYSVVVGANRVTSRRFSQEYIEYLQMIKWWDWPEELVNKAVPLLHSKNVEGLVEYYYNYVK